MKTTKEGRDSLRAVIGRSKFPTIADKSILALIKDIDTLKAALEQIEWVRDNPQWYNWCPWCGNDKKYGHEPDCPRQLALREE